MNRTKKASIGFTLIITLLMSALSTGMVFAAEGDQIDVTGYIMELNPIDGTITIDVDGNPLTEEDVYIVLVGDNFNFDNHLVGDLINVQGTVGEDDVVLLTQLKIMDRIKDQLKLRDGEGDAYFCTDLEKVHPVAEKIAGTYGVDYEIILSYLCAEPAVPLGQIMLALQTAAQQEDVDFTAYLDGFENISWGQIWQELGIQGKPDKGVAPGQIQDKQGEEDSKGEDGKGKNGKDGEGFDLEELLPDWLPQSWFQKGKK